MDGVKILKLFLWVVLIAGCGNVMDDLNPPSTDNRPPVVAGTTGPSVGQKGPDFTLSNSLGASVTLSTVLSSPTTSGVVLYFTMWCPVCDAEMSDIQNSFITQFPNVTFFSVDYVSNSVSAAWNEQIANGFDGSGFVVLADAAQTALTLYHATMGTTVVIDTSGVIRMNEVYKPAKLQSILGGLQ